MRTGPTPSRALRRHAGSVFLMGAIGLGWVTGVAAQACCSAAPSASPGSVSGQGVGSLFPGQGWVQVAVSSLDTRSQFDGSRRKEPYFLDGRLDLQSLLVTGAVGVVTGLEVWAQGAVHSLEFADASGANQRAGLGDVRLLLRAGPRLLGVYESDLPVWIGLRAGVKLPGSGFPVDARIVPLSEGQTDFELALELGRVLVDGRLAVQAWAGHRWRRNNEAVQVRPGNEWYGYASVAGGMGPVQVRVGAQVLDGSPYDTFGLELPSSQRELFGFFPTIAAQIGPGTVELGAQLPVAGRNLPAGTALTVGYTIGFGEPRLPSLEDLFRP